VSDETPIKQPPESESMSAIDDLDHTIGVPRARAAEFAGRSLPREIGGYKILGFLGEGGMGTVYEAEQPSPRRLVALKVIRGLGFGDDLRRKMFEREAATLARLDHPNIGKIYQSGQTEDGRNFLAMELVRGPSLDDWLSARPAVPDRSEIELRLHLFRQVCDAVNYAHQRGVVHRDLKPSNLIVTEAPASGSGAGSSITPGGMVKVLDFGLARMLEEDASTTKVTEAGAVKGTLAYMAPEQARGDLTAIDVRTDVYALGVILYELLTRKMPYSVETGSFLSALSVICEQPPQPLAAAWNASFRLDPDLATIVSMALEKEPDRRYASAAAFADDITRFLGSQPIQARPASTIYQLKKLISRRKPVFATAGVALALVIASAIVTGVLYVRSEANLKRALEAEKSANRTSNFLVELFHRANPEKTRGATVTAKEVMDEGARSVGAELSSDPLLQARLMLTIGEVYGSLGEYGPAGEQIEKAVALRRAHLPKGSPEIAEAVARLAQNRQDLGKPQESEKLYQEAIASYERLGPEGHGGLGRVLGSFTRTLATQGKYEQAASAAHRSLALANQRDPVDEGAELQALMDLASVQEDVHKVDSALINLGRALEISRRIHGQQDAKTASILSDMSVAYAMGGKLPEATRYQTDALQIDRATYGESHPVVARDLGNVGIHLAEQGKNEEALPYFKGAVDATVRIYGPNHPISAQAWMNLGSVTFALGKDRETAGKKAQANDLYQASIGELQHSVDLYERAGLAEGRGISFSLSHLADPLMGMGRMDQAADALRRVLAIDEKNTGLESEDVAGDLEGLVPLERALGHAAEADRLDARMKQIKKKLGSPPTHP
jgi:serine/threonine protein kinase/Tfp pilus assembly protein PilF